jgi:curli production assembly/transport component CsgF
MSRIGLGFLCVVGMAACALPAFATEQVYHPVSPTFGGNPNNGPFLLSTAQAQGEGVKSGNQGPDLTGLDSALANLGNPASGTNGTAGNNGTTGNNGANAARNNAIHRNSVANPLGANSGMP